MQLYSVFHIHFAIPAVSGPIVYDFSNTFAEIGRIGCNCIRFFIYILRFRPCQDQLYMIFRIHLPKSGGLGAIVFGFSYRMHRTRGQRGKKGERQRASVPVGAPLHLRTFAPPYLYTFAPPYLYTSAPPHLHTIYTSTPLHLYTSAPLVIPTPLNTAHTSA